MVIFFFVVGLEIKREVLTGELASLRRALLPIAAAVGGMVCPALIYAALNYGTPEIHGWGIPMATDIAFALGILALLGNSVPMSLKVFLAALAIVDDLGAVLVIAVFYTSEIDVAALLAGGGILLLMVVLNRLGVRSALVYFFFGVALWLCFLQSGVHATIAGVLAALTIPATTLIDEDTFLARSRFLIGEIKKPDGPEELGGHREKVRNLASNLELSAEHVQPPLHRLKHALHPWTAFLIMPVFALANAGISVGGHLVELLTEAATIGVLLGLVIGKQVGVTLFAWLAVRLGWASLPKGVSWKQIYAVGWLAGIGFTMSLFIAGLAFDDEHHLMMGKVGILLGSLAAGAAGYILLRLWSRPKVA
jgi:NhaA family Na+:H+ antiporter